MAIGQIIIINFLLGLLSAFSPCLFPLLPGYVAMSLHTEQSQVKSLLSSLAVISGVILVFLIIGQLLDYIGQFLLSNYSLFAKIQGSLLILAGIILIYTPDFISSITLPQGLQNRLFNDDTDHPIFYSFLIGIIFTVIAAPCASAYFLVVLSNMINTSILTKILIVLSFAFGVGLPFIVMSIFVPELKANMIKNVHTTTRRVNLLLAPILIIIGIWLMFSTSSYDISFLS